AEAELDTEETEAHVPNLEERKAWAGGSAHGEGSARSETSLTVAASLVCQRSTVSLPVESATRQGQMPRRGMAEVARPAFHRVGGPLGRLGHSPLPLAQFSLELRRFSARLRIERGDLRAQLRHAFRLIARNPGRLAQRLSCTGERYAHNEGDEHGCAHCFGS